MSDIIKRETLYRGENYSSILNTSILICGVGALGSHTAESLVRMGFTNITALDFDIVDEGNISTQVYGVKQLSVKKVQALQLDLFQKTGTQIKTIDKKLNDNNIKKYFKEKDIILDCFDNSPSRQLIYNYCCNNNIDCLHAGSADGYSEICWNEYYKVPLPEPSGDGDDCEYSFARNLATITSGLLIEHLIPHLLGKNNKSVKLTFSLLIPTIKKVDMK